MRAEQLRQEETYDNQLQQIHEDPKLPLQRGDKEPLRAFLERQTREQIERILRIPFKELPNKLIPKPIPLTEKPEKNVRFSQDMPPLMSPIRENKEKTPFKDESKKARELQKSANRIKYLTASGKIQEPKLDDGKIEFNQYNTSKNLKQEIAQMTVKIREKQEFILEMAKQLGDSKKKCEAIKHFITTYKSNGVDIGVIEDYTNELTELAESMQKATLTVDEGTDANIYDQLADLINQMNLELDDAKLYYENQMAKQLKLCRAPFEKEIADLTKKNADLKQERNMISENSSSKKVKRVEEVTENNREREMQEQILQKDYEIKKLQQELNDMRLIEKTKNANKCMEVTPNQDQIRQIADLKKEAESLINEVHIRDIKITELKNEYEEKKNVTLGECAKMRDDLKTLTEELDLKEKESVQMKDEYEKMIKEKDEIRNRQKNEWAEIYANLKQEIDDLKNDITTLNNENDKLMKQLELTHQSRFITK